MTIELADNAEIYYDLDDFIPDLERTLARLEQESKEVMADTGSPSPVVYSTLGLNGYQVEKVNGVDSLVFTMDYRPSTCAAIKDFVISAYSWTNRHMPLYLRLSAHLVSPIDASFIDRIFSHTNGSRLEMPIIRVPV